MISSPAAPRALPRRALWLVSFVMLAACGGGGGFDTSQIDATDITDTRVVFEAGADTMLPGRVCRQSADCDDGVPCTDDLCGNDNRCVNLPNAGSCDDHVYCNGAERCDMRRGCIRGEPITCNDNNVCTQDRCIEASRTCEHHPLDRDNDGDPDIHCHAIECGDAGVPEPDAGVMTPCWRGHDCDDTNPTVNSLSPEICGDMLDNNCNGPVDNAEPGGCMRAPHDRCDDPLDISAGGVFVLDMSAAIPDYTFTCAGGVAHDVATRFHLDAPADVSITGSSSSNVVAVAIQSTCGSTMASATLECDYGFPGTVRRHSLPAGDYFVLVASSGSGTVDLDVRFTAATPVPSNDTCATATSIPLTGGTFRSDLIGVVDNVNTACGGTARDVIYTFTLTGPQDVTLQVAGSRSDYFNLSLLSDCGAMPTTLRCDSGAPIGFTAHQLAAGTYYVVVESFDPVAFTLQASFGAPTPPAAGDTCANPLELTTAAPVMVSSAGMENDYGLSCTRTGHDTVLHFRLTERQDVRVAASSGGSDFFGLALTNNCGTRPSERTCVTATNAQAFGLGLDPGDYYVIVKPFRDTDYTVTLNTYPPLAVTDVTGNDTCATAHAVPPGRGYFRGDTSALTNNYNSPCAGMTAAPDAVYSLHLDAQQRVTAVTDSSFFHVVWITQADRCPGTAPTSSSCTLGTHTTLDNVLPAGDYYIFVDGLSTTYSGPYGLLVQLSAP